MSTLARVTVETTEASDELVRAIRAKLAEIPGLYDLRVSYDGRRAPVQGDDWRDPGGTVSWEVHEQAWREYARAGHGSQSAERMAERGGFGYREMQCALAGHYDRAVCGAEHPPIPTYEPRMGRGR